MAFDSYVKIDGIEGESTDSKHSGWIEAIHFSAGVSQTVSITASSAGGATTGRADVRPFTFFKEVDSSSPKLFQACAAGTHFNKITIAMHRSGGDEKVKFLEYELTNCIISDVSINSGSEDFPTESISIDFGKIIVSYVKQYRKGGGPAGKIMAGWDLQKNCKV